MKKIIVLFVAFLSLNVLAQQNQEDVSLWRGEPFGTQNMSKEIVDKRDEFSKHFDKGDGQITAHIASGPIHYEENGEWKTIYHTISPRANGFENIHNSHKTYFPATATGEIKTVLSNGATLKDMIGMKMYFEANGQAINVKNIKNTPGQANFNELTYPNAYGYGIDLLLTQQTTKRKMDYVIHSLEAVGNIPNGANYLVFEETVELPQGWKAELRENVIYLLDASGEIQALYEKPVFEDAHVHTSRQSWDNLDNDKDKPENNQEQRTAKEGASNNTESEKIGDYQISQNGTLLTIKTLVEMEWLTSEERSFPVKIDPTINFDPEALAHTGRSWNTGSPSCADGHLIVGRDGNYARGQAKFITSSLSSFQANSVTLHFYIYYNNFYNGDNQVLEFYRMGDRNSFACSQLYNATIASGVIYHTTGLMASQSGSVNFLLGALSNADISDGSGEITVGFQSPGDFWSGEYMDIDGYSNTYKPYLVVDYTTPPYAAEVTSINYGSNDWCIGEERTVTATIKNTGTATWYASGSSACPAPDNNNKVALAYKWNGDANWDAYNYAPYTNRFPLPNDVAPGESITMTFNVPSPNGDPPGVNNLSINLIAQECAWFNGGNASWTSPSINVSPSPTGVNAGPDKIISCGGSVQLEGSVTISSAPTQTLGTTNSGNSRNGFTNGYYDYSYSRHLYREGELGGAKWIQSIDIYVHNTPSNYTMNNQRIYLKNVGGILQYNTPYNAGSNGANNPDSDNSYSKVYDGTITFNGSGWFTINFSSPFYYSGTGSLELIWENRDGSYNTNNYPTFRYHANWGYNCSVRDYRDNSFPVNYDWGVFSNRYWIRFNSLNNTYSWSGGPIVSGENTLTPTVNPTATTTYTLTQTLGNCTATDQVTVTVTPLDISGPSTICLSGTVNYDAPGELPAGATFPTGGSISTFDNYRIHEFTTSGTFNPQGFAPLNARILVVGGGGGGGVNGGGGGGAGGFLDQAGINIAASTTVVVGAGGDPHNNISNPNTAATNGSQSAFGTYTAGGGGGGASRDYGVGGQNGGTGTIQGSGGGGGGATGTPRNSAGTGFRNGGAGTLGESCLSSGGGGGGSNGNGTAGTATITPKGGDGGAGTLSNITGTPSYYAGGGGGGYTGYPGCGNGFVSGTLGAGGSGVGGGSNGTPKANTGSGGGQGQKGADGVVIVRYIVPKWSVTNGTGSATIDEITGELTPVTAGTVTITFINENGCEVSKVITIEEVSTPPTASTGGGNYCHGNVITLTQSGGTDASGAVDVWYAAEGETAYDPNSCNNEGFIELWNEFEYNDPNCHYEHRNTDYNVSNGTLKAEALTDPGGDPFIWMYPLPNNATIDADEYKHINVRYRVTNYVATGVNHNPRMGVLFTKRTGACNPSGYPTGDYPFSLPGQSGSYRKDINTDGNWHVVSFPIHAHHIPSNQPQSNWNGTVTGLRLDYFDPYPHDGNNGSSMEVDFITVSKHPMVGEGKTLTLSPGDEYYPTQTTTYYAKKIDNCGATLCVDETVVLPPIGTTLSNNNESATCVVNANEFIHFYHTSGRFLGSINANGGNLGNVTMTTFVGAPAYMEDCNQPGHSSFHTAYMGRRWIMNSDIYTNGSDFGNNVSVRLPYNNSELVALNNFAQTDTPNNPFDGGTIDPQATRQNMMLTKITGATEDGNATQADCTGTIRGIANGGNGINPEGISNTEYIDFSIQQFSEFFLHKHQDNSPLPVELTNLSASCNKEVQINWTTASEKNSERFVVEKSRDGQTWTFVSEEQAAGNSTTTISYTVIDTQPSDGISYYRLRQVDFDGKEKIYGPISVSCDGISNSMVVYPNPNDGTFVVEITSSEEYKNSILEITDITGRLITTQNVDIVQGTNSVLMDNSSLVVGTYIVNIRGIDGSLKPVKVIVR